MNEPDTVQEWTTDIDGWELRASSRREGELPAVAAYLILVGLLCPLVLFVLFRGGLAQVAEPAISAQVVVVFTWVAVAVGLVPTAVRAHRARGELVLREHADGRFSMRQEVAGGVVRTSSLDASQYPILTVGRNIYVRMGTERYKANGLSQGQRAFLRERFDPSRTRDIGSSQDVPVALREALRQGGDER